MTEDRLDELRHMVKMFGNVTPAAQVASELLAEVEFLRQPWLPPPPRSVEEVAAVLGTDPRNVQRWIDERRLRQRTSGLIDGIAVLDLLQRNGANAAELREIAEKLWTCTNSPPPGSSDSSSPSSPAAPQPPR